MNSLLRETRINPYLVARDSDGVAEVCTLECKNAQGDQVNKNQVFRKMK